VNTFDAVWRRIEEHAGKEFRTKTGLPSIYEVAGTSVVPDRTGYPLHVSNFRAAFDLLPLTSPGQINTLVRGPAYVYAILSDRRNSPIGDNRLLDQRQNRTVRHEAP
jgi:hypothetical protein